MAGAKKEINSCKESFQNNKSYKRINGESYNFNFLGCCMSKQVSKFIFVNKSTKEIREKN